MSSGPNCSEVPPTSDVYLQALTVTELVFTGVAAALCLGVILLFLDKVYFIYRHFGNYGTPKSIRDKSMLLVGIYPVVAVTSLLAVFIPRSELLSDFVATAYLAVCLYEFTTLIILYCGGKAEVIEKTRTSGFKLRAPPCCCCCWCCPTVIGSADNLNRLQMLVLQTSFIQPSVAVMSMVLWLDGKYNPNVTTVNSTSTYLSIISVISSLLAMYGLVVIFRATRAHLKTYSITPKFLLLQLVLVVVGLQKFILKILAGSGIPACDGAIGSAVRADTIQHMLAIGEMFLLAFLARIFYRKPMAYELLGGYSEMTVSGDEITDTKLCQDKAAPEQEGDRQLEQSGLLTAHKLYDTMGVTRFPPTATASGERSVCVESSNDFHLVGHGDD